MFSSLLSSLILAASLSHAAPVRRDVALDQAATASAQQRDNTATRAFTAVPIKTSDGLCLSVDPFSGDFRENLIPIKAVQCNGSANQTWDVITSGKHDNVAGAALIVSSLTNGCMNFDPRRAAGNQVLLFSCGGRGDGTGQVTSSQLFNFAGGSGSVKILLVPQNGNNATCLTITNGALDQSSCNPATASGEQLFTIGSGSTAAPPPPPPPPPAASNSAVAAPPASSASVAAPAGTGLPPGTTILDQAATAEAQQRDDTATRAFSAVPIKTADGQCLFIDPLTGDSRENLIPVQTRTCDGSAAQQWDVITSGKHDNVAGAALIVSTLTNGCLNFDPRRAAGNQVLLFSCGGRADGSGQVTNSQLFNFNGASGPLPLVPQNGNNATCLTINGQGLLDQSACNPATASGEQLFTIGSGSAAAAPPPSSASNSAPPPPPASSAAPPPPPASSSSSAAVSTGTGLPPGTVMLNQAATAEAQQRDNTATRAFAGVPIKTANGQCLFIDPLTGDFRENLIPVQTRTCDGSAAQQWDVITSGKHNNVAGAALIVSTLTNGCLNFDPRRAAGNQVLLFSCGGRADGSGQVTNSQLFNFAGGSGALTIPLVPQNGNNATCLTINAQGLVDQSACNPATASGEQLFTID